MNHYRHILLATDLTPTAETITARAVKLSQREQARLSVLYVLEHFPEDLPANCIPPEDQDPKRFITEQVNAQLRDLAKHFGIAEDGLKTLISTDSAKAEILKYATANHVDLIVMGARAHAGFSGFLGSTAAAVVLAAPCDVLAVRI
jgi:universal stress protein A